MMYVGWVGVGVVVGCVGWWWVWGMLGGGGSGWVGACCVILKFSLSKYTFGLLFGWVVVRGG